MIRTDSVPSGKPTEMQFMAIVPLALVSIAVPGRGAGDSGDRGDFAVPVAIQAVYPTGEHARAADATVGFFSGRPEVDAVLLMGSCARGKASRDSCIDFIVLAPPEQQERLEVLWKDFYEGEAVFEDLRRVGLYTHVDLDFSDGEFRPQPRGWTSGPDEFELEVGNTLAYTVALWERGDRLKRLREQWLPYYDEGLRRERLVMACKYGLNNLDHVAPYAERELYFQCFHRLYDAFREFLQALFIARRTYPIAYDKWVREQVVEILGLPELYGELTHILEIQPFESRAAAEKAEALRALFERYAVA